MTGLPSIKNALENRRHRDARQRTGLNGRKLQEENLNLARTPMHQFEMLRRESCHDEIVSTGVQRACPGPGRLPDVIDERGKST